MKEVEKNNPMKLDDGNVVCSKCGGTGRVRSGRFRHNCVKCRGKGQIDWVENIMGKVQKPSGSGGLTQQSVKSYVNAKCAK